MTWPIGTVKLVQWVRDINKVREMYCQGWDIVCVYVLHWGVNTLMEIDEKEFNNKVGIYENC